ncbi:hypothetical protein OAU93_01305 [bacterium]|nr:hypothetical protein [bacterium]
MNYPQQWPLYSNACSRQIVAEPAAKELQADAVELGALVDKEEPEDKAVELAVAVEPGAMVEPEDKAAAQEDAVELVDKPVELVDKPVELAVAVEPGAMVEPEDKAAAQEDAGELVDKPVELAAVDKAALAVVVDRAVELVDKAVSYRRGFIKISN